MMTIKAFAELCGCTAQTLRYYDRIGLLTPARVDKWTGYRYYEEWQALDFVKIRNLQAADFAISEIETLLTQSDEAVCAAFDVKIAAQEEKLARIREIRQTYLHEKDVMEKLLNGLIDYLLGGCKTPAVLREFGYEEADYDRVMATLRAWLEKTFAMQYVQADRMVLEVNGDRTEGAAQVTQKLAELPRGVRQDVVYLNDGTKCRDNGGYEVVWEKHGWVHPREFLQEIPPLTGERPYKFELQITGDSCLGDLSYGMFLIGVLMLERGVFPCRGCEVSRSVDGVNRFRLSRAR